MYYKQEAQENEAKLTAMKASGEGNIKQQEGVLAESLQMIPHSETMLKKNLEELLTMVQETAAAADAGGDGGEGSEWLVAAKTLLAENGMGDDRANKGGEETTAVDDLKEGEAF